MKKEIVIIRRTFPRELSEDLESQFDGIFTLINVTRNEPGDLAGRHIDRGAAYTNLELFLLFCKRIYGLIDFLNNHED